MRVTEGYRLQPELNKAKFKLIGYKSVLCNGELTFITKEITWYLVRRMDRQVQVNGIRIELDRGVKSIVR